VISSVEQLTTLGLLDENLAPVIRSGDWYLVGSRALGTADELSDWDTIVVVGEGDADRQPSGALVDQAFGVARPQLSGLPDLAGHVRWRGVAAVEVAVMDPDACEHREHEDLASWVHELACAVPLHISTGIGERYRMAVADRFAEQARRLAEREYRAFRLARHQAVSALARADVATQALTSARCVGCAGRFWMLASGRPYPADKWLLTIVERAADSGALPGLLRQVLDADCGAAARFDALWELWRLVDERAHQTGLAASLLAGSPFVSESDSRKVEDGEV
jgi:hypothetical protein